MKLKQFLSAVVLLMLSFFCTVTWATEYAFEVKTGSVTVTSVFCPPGQCQVQKGAFTGSFIADISDDEILFSKSNIRSTVEAFSLPANPSQSLGGTVREINFEFDGSELTARGVINQSAFDGPITEYEFVAILQKKAQLAGQHYFARQDFRKCVSPMCGGIYVKKANRRFMRCIDGKRSRECYIGSPDWSAVGGSPFEGNEELLIQGGISHSTLKGINNFGAIEVSAAYRATNKRRRHSWLFSVKNNGLVCITSPCFSYDQSLLNSKFERVLSGVDLTRAKADKTQIEVAQELLANGEPVIATGYHRRTKGLAGRGLKFVAKNLYLPVNRKSIIKLCPLGYTETLAGCATLHGCFFPEIEMETIGGAAMVDPVTGEFIAQVSHSCVAKCEAPAELVGPGKCQLALP